MTKKCYLLSCLFSILIFIVGSSVARAQESQPEIHVVVNMVQLNVAVTDNKGNYVTGLKPEDFIISEDGIAERIATFGEGNGPARRVIDVAANGGGSSVGEAFIDQSSPRSVASADPPGGLSALLGGSNVFILFDTSNYMYRGFVFAQDSIADFIRSLENADKIAFYSYSRDLSRSAFLTTDRTQVLRGVRSTVAGDDAALYNCLLLTVKDAAQYRGRKVIVVFSNGPDNSSVVRRRT
jgi:Ca-activated chloride channel homolog